MRLLIARLDPRRTAALAANPALLAEFGPPVVVAQTLTPEVWDPVRPLCREVYLDLPDASKPHTSRDLLDSVVRQHDVGYVLAPQKLLWYSDVLQRVAAHYQVQLVWTEAFFEDRMIFDRAGLQYCESNDLHTYWLKPSPPPRPMDTARERQPAAAIRSAILAKYRLAGDANPVVVLGQTPYDMSLVQYPWVGYRPWLTALLKNNPETTFLFKHHPLAETPGVAAHNLVVVDEAIDALLSEFSLFASFSSTTIFQGAMRGRAFATGGYHLMDRCGLDVPVTSPGACRGVADQLRAHRPDPTLLAQRVGFIQHRYTIQLGSPDVLRRLKLTSDEYFNATLV